jgi:hypothetical protein
MSDPPQPPDSLEQDDTFRRFVESNIQLTYHPAFEELADLLRIQFPADLRLLFELSAASFNTQRSLWFPTLVALGGDQRKAYEMLHMNVQEGLRSSYYHLGNFLRIEDEVKRLGVQLHRMLAPASGTTLGMPAASLNSEWESFTFLSRATLDRLAGLIRLGLGIPSKHNLLKLATWLEKNRPGARETQAYVACLDRHRDYLHSQISSDKGQRQTVRDRIAHVEYVQFAGVNLFWQADGMLAVWTTSDPSTGHDAGKVLSAQFYELADLVVDLVVTFVGLDHYWDRSPRPR